MTISMTTQRSDSSWAAQGQCRDLDPDGFFVQGADQRQVKALCAACPVRIECLADALDNRIEFGVWGGMPERGRRALLRRRRTGMATRGKLHQHNVLHGLPLKMRFPKSKLYISALLPFAVGAFVGLLAALMGVGGGFIMVPAMIYVLGMPTSVVVGTSLFQIIFVTGRGKTAIVEHFDIAYELEATLRARGREEALALLKDSAVEPGSMVTVRQSRPAASSRVRAAVTAAESSAGTGRCS